MERSWNERQYVAAQRAWEASAAKGIDDDTRRALERLSGRYFWASLGMSRGGMVGEDAATTHTPSPCACDGRTQPGT